jgi:hypothetical protein
VSDTSGNIEMLGSARGLQYAKAVLHFKLTFFYLTIVAKLGCPRNNQIFFSVRTETNRNSICFGCFSVCFAKPKNILSVSFGLIWRFGPVSKQPKQTELCQNKPKQTEKMSKKRSLLGVKQ